MWKENKGGGMMERLTEWKDDKKLLAKAKFSGDFGSQNILQSLAEYEDLEERGLLLRLPCGIGADIYFVPSRTNFKLNILQDYPQSNRVYHQTVERITFTENGWYLECDKNIDYAIDRTFSCGLYKEIWFTSREEAEQKLKEMESN